MLAGDGNYGIVSNSVTEMNLLKYFFLKIGFLLIQSTITRRILFSDQPEVPLFRSLTGDQITLLRYSGTKAIGIV